jgi:hypothetical protein
MNIRILAASALALAILVPAANAATPNHTRSTIADNHGSGADKCPGGDLNLGTADCVPFRAKVVHARVVKHVTKPATAFSSMTAIQNSHNEM